MHVYIIVFSIDLESCDDGQVRLIDGYSYREGRVEVCFNQMWESVCNLGQEGIAGEACYQAGFLREGIVLISQNTQHFTIETQVP